MDYSVSEARNGLPGLIDKACAGERVVITRHGQPVAELRPTPMPTPIEGAKSLSWLRERRRRRPRIIVDSLDVLKAEADESRW